MNKFDLEVAQPYYFQGNEIGCLLIHGFTAAPSEMRPLGDYLHEKGFTVYGIRLAGHGTTVEDLMTKSHLDWIESAKKGYMRLKENCKKIFIIGLSMGALLTLDLAKNEEVDGVVVMATPIYLRSKLPYLSPIFKYIIPMQHKKAWQKFGLQKKYSISYDLRPMYSIQELIKLIKKVKIDLNRINKSILIMQSNDDTLVKSKSAKYIYDHISSEKKKIMSFENSGHIITLGKEYCCVYENVFNFIEKILEEMGYKEQQ